LVAATVLPPTILLPSPTNPNHAVEIHGSGARVLWLDCDSKFSVFRFCNIVAHDLTARLPQPAPEDETFYQRIALECLDRILVVRPTSALDVLHLLFSHAIHAQSDIKLCVLDPVSAFYHAEGAAESPVWTAALRRLRDISRQRKWILAAAKTDTTTTSTVSANRSTRDPAGALWGSMVDVRVHVTPMRQYHAHDHHYEDENRDEDEEEEEEGQEKKRKSKYWMARVELLRSIQNNPNNNNANNNNNSTVKHAGVRYRVSVQEGGPVFHAC
jgi:hypothetical protein